MSVMTFDQLVERLTDIPFDEVRKKYDGYLEIVLSGNHVGRLYPELEKFFGVPFKPAGVEPSEGPSQDFAKRYGGIRKHQTLYFLTQGEKASCAMIWPWENGGRVTLKLARGAMNEIKR